MSPTPERQVCEVCRKRLATGTLTPGAPLRCVPQLDQDQQLRLHAQLGAYLLALAPLGDLTDVFNLGLLSQREAQAFHQALGDVLAVFPVPQLLTEHGS
jgi:hypothetical protein